MNLLGYSVLFIIWGCCTAQDPCGKPQQIPKEEPASALKAEYNDGEIITYNCQPGYIKLGRLQYRCENGEWKKTSAAVCKEKPCGHPGDIQFGTFEITRGEEFVFGARVVYTCDAGYQMISRVNYRDCGAKGWSNSVPFCEQRKCLPIQAPIGGRIVMTGTHEIDGEISVGHVVRFECDSPLARPVPSEIYCKENGEWSNNEIECKEISCLKPAILHGTIRNEKVFRKSDTLDYTCDDGYKSEGRAPECTEQGWNPVPACTEIICYYEDVENGEVLPKQNAFKEGDTIDLRCNSGYQAVYDQGSPPTCTKSGWVPPPRCKSKACNYPEIENGKLDYWAHRSFPSRYFPMDTGKSIYYRCNRDFLTSFVSDWGEITCRLHGWDPTPKCFRTCNRVHLENMDIVYRYDKTIVGATVVYRCYSGYTTPDGKDYGNMQCLADGTFSPAKCIRTCTLQATNLVTYKPARTTFQSQEKLQYECANGYKTVYNNIVEKVKCDRGAWEHTPECEEITCDLQSSGRSLTSTPAGRTFYNGAVVKFWCSSRSYTLRGADKIQCYYFGWYPQPPSCEVTRDSDSHSESEIPDHAAGGNCPQPPALANTIESISQRAYNDGDTVTYECKTWYKPYGSKTITCEDGRWTSPPQCIELERCQQPPVIENGQIFGARGKSEFYSEDTVAYSCKNGYHITGSHEITCIGGSWPSPPKCTENTCDAPVIAHGGAIDLRPPYANAATVQFTCEVGYALKNNEKTICSKGKWLNLPSCLSTACYSTPKVQDAVVIGNEKKIYSSDEKVFYKCKQGFAFEKLSYTICQEGLWTEIPVCKREGQKCGPAPSIANGDVDGARKDSYNSGTIVEYKCQSYYIPEGTTQVTCRNGAWSDLPQCLEPCTASPEEMMANNILLKWSDKNKLYIKHKEWVEFDCLSKQFVKDKDSIFRLTCNRGKLTYPKCIKLGSCVISQADMEQKNVITERENTEVPKGQSVSFTCKPGFYSTPGKDMNGKCIDGNLNYPVCGSTPPLCSPPPNIEHGSIKGVRKLEYQHESSVEYICNAGYALEGIRSLTCTGGSWSADAPVCKQSCYLSQAELSRNNLELLQADPIDEPVKHKQSIDFKCKEGYIEKTSLELSGHCDNGNIIYPVCAENMPCKVTDEKLNENNLAVHDKHRSTVNFKNGTIIEFKCKSGFSKPPSLLVTCDENGIIYPTCFSNNPCRILQEDMDTNHVVLHEKNEKVMFKINETIEFKCKTGFYETGPLSATCFQSKIAYPKCISERPCLLSRKLIEDNHLQFSATAGNIDYIEDGQTIDFSCKDQYRKHARSSDMSQVCEKGIIAYPICVYAQA